MSDKIRVTVWGENVHEKKLAEVGEIYPKGMHECIADAVAKGARVLNPGCGVSAGTLFYPAVVSRCRRA